MFKKTQLGMAIALAIGLPNLASAYVETTMVLKNETAVFLSDSQRTGEAATMLDRSGEGRSLAKFENSATMFFNGDIGEESSWHGELKVIYDPVAIRGYNGYKEYSQHDWFRELYVDTNAGDWDFRLGKQQVVWGTADGIKLLDIINPTDFRELSQNSMEESRIPVWMVNGERNVGDSSNVQLIVSQAKAHQIPGLNNSGDPGHPFLMKGVDTITGRVNGFTSIANAMGGVTSIFYGGGFTDPSGIAPSPTFGPEFATVGAYTAGTYSAAVGPGFCAAPVAVGISGSACLKNFTDNPLFGGPFSNNGVTNLTDADPATGAGWDPSNPNSTWEYMTNATFATFNTYVGMTSRYDKKLAGDTDANFGGRFRTNFDNGLNLGINYLYAYDPNPVVNVHFEDGSGNRLVARDFTTFSRSNVTQIQNQSGTQGYGAPVNFNNGSGNDSGNMYVGGTAPLDVITPSPVVLVFEEKQTRVHNIGSSFDYAMDAGDIPLVIRGEFLYQKDVHQPVVDRNMFSNLTAALTTRESDFFKYVIGVDATFFTNLLVSGQFIQFRNLDYVDSMVDSNGAPCTTANCGVYTADPSTMHLSNGLQKGWENKEFYSLFLSKPFGESQLGRVNNILIYEEGGGFWDRIDAEYSLTDQIVLTGEVNLYWGDQDTTFGQFKNSSNAQVGVKFILE